MISFTEQLKTLRTQTGAGMVDCKNALTESNGDFDLAVEILRKRGAALAAKKSGRIAAEGLLGFANSADGQSAALIELNCETDFVAKNDEFIALSEALAGVAANGDFTDLDAFLQMPFNGQTVQSTVEGLTGKIGEKLSLRRFVRFKKSDSHSAITTYLHPGNKIGVMILSSGASPDKASETAAFLKDLAMHVAAMYPQYLDPSEIPAEKIEKEREIFLANMAEEKKPAEILAKIVEGKIAKFKKEVSLLYQPFVKDPEGKKTVAEWIKAHFPTLSISQFVRLQVGEGIEKKKENFVEEVMKQAAQGA